MFRIYIWFLIQASYTKSKIQNKTLIFYIWCAFFIPISSLYFHLYISVNTFLTFKIYTRPFSHICPHSILLLSCTNFQYVIALDDKKSVFSESLVLKLTNAHFNALIINPELPSHYDLLFCKSLPKENIRR